MKMRKLYIEKGTTSNCIHVAFEPLNGYSYIGEWDEGEALKSKLAEVFPGTMVFLNNGNTQSFIEL